MTTAIPFEGSLIDALKCDFGIHRWKEYHSMSHVGKDSASFGGYIFLPSTLHFFFCERCYATKQEITNFRGDLE